MINTAWLKQKNKNFNKNEQGSWKLRSAGGGFERLKTVVNSNTQI